MPSQSGHHVAPQAFRDLVMDIPFAMVTTIMADGSLRSRPMVAHAHAYDGMLWFFTRAIAPVVADIAANAHVHVAYASPAEDRFVSVSGQASVVRDAAQATRLWTDGYAKWFAGGPQDPELSLIRIDVARVEYWDPKGGRMAQL
jgi:general stress protein 26